MLTVLTLGSAGISACGSTDGNPYGLSDFQGGEGSAAGGSGGSSASVGSSGAAVPSASATTAPPGPKVNVPAAPEGAVGYTPSDVFNEGAWVERGVIAATSGVRKAVADAVVAYLTERVELSNTWVVDEPALAAVATGQALTSARKRAAGQRAADRRTIGKFVVNLSTVSVRGDTAVATGCPLDGTVEVSAQGSVMTDPAGGLKLTMDLRQRGGRWRAVTFPTTVEFCEVPRR